MFKWLALLPDRLALSLGWFTLHSCCLDLRPEEPADRWTAGRLDRKYTHSTGLCPLSGPPRKQLLETEQENNVLWGWNSESESSKDEPDRETKLQERQIERKDLLLKF